MQLNLVAPINTTSYGIASTNILIALQNLGVEVSLFPISGMECDQDKVEYVQAALELAKKPNFQAPSLRIFHQNLLAEHVSSTLRIGFPIFELDRFNEIEKHHLSNQDRLFVCSDWAKEIISRNGIDTPTHVVPLGVDRTIFNENVLPTTLPGGPNTYRFFNCGKIEIRKGHDLLVHMFNEAFTPEDDVALIISWQNRFMTDKENEEWIRYYKNSKLGDKIHFVPWVKSPSELASVMAACDCGVFPSRAEGWMMPALEMLSMGKKVITTRYSGHTQYVNDINSSLVNVVDGEMAVDGKWFFGQGQWARIGEVEFKSFVRYMSQHRTYNNRGNKFGIETAKEFSWENTAQSIIKGLV